MEIEVRPRSHIIIERRVMTLEPTTKYIANFDSPIEQVSIMNSRYPLYSVPLTWESGLLKMSIDLSHLFAGRDSTELRVNILGLDDAGRDIRKSPVLINGERSCNLKERCFMRPGEYQIETDLLGIRIDSIKFNGARRDPNAKIFDLSSALKVKFNTLVFYAQRL